MSTLEKSAAKIAATIGRRWLNITVEARGEIAKLIVAEMQPMVAKQRTINFVNTERRLAGQAKKILDLLQTRRAGGATNRELASISLKYTSRISDIRKTGITIRCEELHDGLTVYRIDPRDWDMSYV